MNLLFVGCGKMGSALLKGSAKKADQVIVIKPSPLANIESYSNVLWLPSLDKIDPDFHPDVIILAVKPQKMAEVLPSYARYNQSVFLSVAAGLTLARLNDVLGHKGHAIVRSMPNLPSSIGMGMSVAVTNGAATQAQRNMCDQILRAAGEVAWIEDESLIDPVTAVSGCGPAYVFALIEAMASAGEKLGLPAVLAQKLAQQTIIGSGALLAKSDQSAACLRQAVASPGGTTEAALKHLLDNNGIFPLMLRAMQSAAKRAKEMAALY